MPKLCHSSVWTSKGMWKSCLLSPCCTYLIKAYSWIHPIWPCRFVLNSDIWQVPIQRDLTNQEITKLLYTTVITDGMCLTLCYLFYIPITHHNSSFEGLTISYRWWNNYSAKRDRRMLWTQAYQTSKFVLSNFDSSILLRTPQLYQIIYF